MRYCPICENQFDDAVKFCPRDQNRTVRVREGLVHFEGRTLDGRWRLERVIGEGGMGAVFAAKQISVEREVAVKLIRAEFAQEEVVVSRFFREAKVLSQLQHPGIVTMLDFGQDEASGALYLVMELLRGKPLSSWLDEGHRYSLAQTLQIALQLTSALAEAHRIQIVHRDLKPDNLFISPVEGGALHLTLLDFGIARVEDSAMTKLTQTGAIQGTPSYMSPEQVEGATIVPQTDLYSMGCILYELLTGSEPFAGEGMMQILMAHMSRPPEPLSKTWSLSEPYFEPLALFVHRLLEKNPEDRPPTAIEALREIQDIQAAHDASMLSGEWPASQHAISPTGGGRAATVLEKPDVWTLSGPVSPQPAPAPTKRPPERSSKWAAIGVGLIVVSLLVLGGTYYAATQGEGGARVPIEATGGGGANDQEAGATDDEAPGTNGAPEVEVAQDEAGGTPEDEGEGEGDQAPAGEEEVAGAEAEPKASGDGKSKARRRARRRRASTVSKILERSGMGTKDKSGEEPRVIVVPKEKGTGKGKGNNLGDVLEKMRNP